MAQDEGFGRSQKKLFILSRDAEHRESKDAGSFMLAHSPSQMARDPVPVCTRLQLRPLCRPERKLFDRAAGVEVAAGRRVNGVRDLALESDAVALGLGGGNRHRREE